MELSAEAAREQAEHAGVESPMALYGPVKTAAGSPAWLEVMIGLAPCWFGYEVLKAVTDVAVPTGTRPESADCIQIRALDLLDFSGSLFRFGVAASILLAASSVVKVVLVLSGLDSRAHARAEKSALDISLAYAIWACLHLWAVQQKCAGTL